MSTGCRGALQSVRFEPRLTDGHQELGGFEGTLSEGNLLPDGDLLSGFAIEHNGPQLSQGIFRMKIGAEERVTNPEGQWARGMIGSDEEAFVVPRCLTGLVAREIDLLTRDFKLSVYRYGLAGRAVWSCYTKTSAT